MTKVWYSDKGRPIKPEMNEKPKTKATIKGAFIDFNKDPNAFVEQRVEARVNKAVEDLKAQMQGFVPRTEAYEIGSTISTHMQDLAANGARPELADPAFVATMQSKAVTDQVYQKFFAGKDAKDVIANPLFYVESYHLAKQIQAGAPAAQANQAQSAQDMQAQRAIIAGHGTPASAGKAPSGSGAPAKDGVAQLLADMKSSASGMDAIASAFKGK